MISGNNGEGHSIFTPYGDWGIYIVGSLSEGNRIIGNIIGADATGSARLSNGYSGISAYGTGAYVIGGSGPGEGNSDLRHGSIGISIMNSDGYEILGNRIGVDSRGNTELHNDHYGIILQGTQNSLVSGNQISGNGVNGIQINGCVSILNCIYPSSGNRVIGNRIGVNAEGTAALDNANIGVYLMYAEDNQIGGSGPGEGNLISGNGGDGVKIDGIGVHAAGNHVIGNTIGADVSGSRALGNGKNGVYIYWSAENQIGGGAAGEGNLISGNWQAGVKIELPTASNNRVLGNRIGTDVSGSVALGNQGDGVLIDQAPGNQIGGGATGEGNLISGNRSNGMVVDNATGNRIERNLIGVDLSGGHALPNLENGVQIWYSSNTSIVGNQISGNSKNGIIFNTTFSEHGPQDTSGNIVTGNRIGTNSAGTSALGNRYSGIALFAAQETQIGGSGPDDGNLISNNGFTGVAILENCLNTTVTGNTIGADISGSLAFPNGEQGVQIRGSQDNQIGGAAPSEGNLISGNHIYGVKIEGSSTSGNRVLGNRIGANAAGDAPLSNERNGVYLSAPDNQIGGTAPGEGNFDLGQRRPGCLDQGNRNSRQSDTGQPHLQ